VKDFFNEVKNMALTTAQIQQAYVTFFSRPADPVGLTYWQSYSGSLSDLYATFAQQTEYSAAFSGLSSSQKVNVVYQNLFGRDAEATGLLYWAGKIESGAITVANLALAVSAGSQGTDKVTVDSRVSAATSFTAALDTAAEVLGYSGAVANAAAKAWLAGVTTAANLATAVAAIDTATSTVVAAGGTTGSTFTLTTSVESVSGGAANDTITGTLGAAGTFNAGDSIYGAGGNDSLNLTDAGSATSVGYTELSSVETVNVRMLSAGTTVLNANGWSGTTKISNASSFDGSTLSVTGVETSTTISLSNDADINVGFRNTTTATNVISVQLSSAGNLGTATTLASAAAGTGGTANLDLDIADTGLITAVSVSLIGSRTDFARLEAGSNVTTYTISGAANAVLVTDDTITSFDASQASGNIDVTFQGVSDVTAKGGAGNDTFRFGTTFANGDSVDGGAGTNTITATIGGFNRNLATTNVQTASITFNDDAGGTVNASASTVATYNVVAGSAGADGNIANMATGSVVNLGSDNLDDVALGYSSAAVGTLNIGSASGSVGIDLLDVSGVASLTINGIGGTAGAGTVAAFSANSTLTSVTIQSSGGEADLTFTSASGAKVQTLNIYANGSGAITLTSGFDAGSAMTTINVVASGDAADVTLGSLALANTALNSVTLSGNSAGDITVGALQFGNGLTADAAGTLTLNAANGSVVGTTAMDISATGSFALTIAANASASGTIAIGDIVAAVGTAATAASAASININAGTIGNNGYVKVEKIDLTGATGGAKLNIGAVTLGTTAGFEIGNTGIFATDIANVNISTTTITVGNDASATIGSGGIFTTGGAVGAITLTVADSGSARFGTIFSSSVGAISANASGDGEVDIAGITGTDAIGNISFVAQNDADITVGAISGSGTVGNITIGVEVSASATFGVIHATSVGAITVSGAGAVSIGGASGANLRFQASGISAAQVGTIDARQLISGTFAIDLSGVTRAAEVYLGNSTNKVVSGKGNDVITLNNGSGADTIEYRTGLGMDSIVNFNTASDIIGLSVSGGLAGASGGITFGSAKAVSGSTVGVQLVTAAGSATIASGISIVLIAATAFASTAAMVSAVATGGSLEINYAAGGGGATAASLVVVWSDGRDSYVSLLGTTAGASGTNAIIENGSAMVTIADISGVTPGALGAANFTFTS